MLTELTKTDLETIEGGNIIKALACAVDNVFDICDDLEINGSCRPFKKYE